MSETNLQERVRALRRRVHKSVQQVVHRFPEAGDFWRNPYKQARAHANSASLFKPWHRAEGHASGTVLQICVRGDHAWHEVRVTTTTRDPFGVAACSGYA